MTEKLRLAAAREELERNLYHLRRYAARVREFDRASPVALTVPDDRAIEAIDQFVLRFLKTVDAVTRRLFPAIMAHLGEYEDGMASSTCSTDWRSWVGSSARSIGGLRATCATG